jgi:hypothetical protein
MPSRKKRVVRKAKFSDAPSVVFAEVQVVLNSITDANGNISMSPHGRFWNTDRNSFVTQGNRMFEGVLAQCLRST